MKNQIRLQTEGSPLTLEIQPTYRLPQSATDSFLDAIREHLQALIPQSFLTEIESFPEHKDSHSLFQRLLASLPMVHWPQLELSQNESEPAALPVSLLCPAQFTHGLGRYIKDTFSRWLIPGKQVTIVGDIGLNFYFKQQPDFKFFFAQQLIGFHNREERKEILKNITPIVNEMKLNITAVYQARYVIALKNYSGAYKTLLIEESLSSLFNRVDDDLYNQIQTLVSQHSSEEKILEVKRNLNQVLQTRPKVFDRDIFYEMTQITSLINEKFSLDHESKNISRLIAYYYLFKKFIEAKVKNTPQERHLSIKVTSVRLKENQPAVSILIVMNFLSDSERFEQRHLIDAVTACLPNLGFVMDSFLSDRREGKILFMYAEFANSDGQKLATHEIKELKMKLPKEVVRHIEKVIHPIFMPRNEEELLRNLVLLSKEIKYVRDLPQVSIHYEKQTENHLFFTVLLVRLKTPASLCLHQIFANGSLRVEVDDIRVLSQLKRRYPKESAILHVSIEKALFFRADFSVDLLRARHKVASELAASLGEFRDFNGGMIIKQEEMLSELRKILSPLSQQNEFLLENYFYSLRPVIAQTIHDPMILKTHFEILLRNIEVDFTLSSRHLFHESYDKYELYFILSTRLSPKLDIRNALGELKKDAQALASCFIQFDRMTALGFIFKNDRIELTQKFDRLVKDLSEKSCCASAM